MNPKKGFIYIKAFSFLKKFSHLHTRKHLFQTTCTKVFKYLDYSELSPQRLVYDKQKKNSWPGNV